MMKRFSILIVFLFGLLTAYAQDKSITGTVVDETGVGMPGATVQVKGTTKGTVTDVNGAYAITAATGSTLQISYVGYVVTEVVVGESNVINTSLVPDVKSLDEIVVVGYGVQKKSLVTAAIAKVDAKAMEKSVSTRFEQALQGRTSGVVVTQSSGAPGAALTVKVRGNSSDGGNAPLYIVDGVKTGGLDYLNPLDIASVEVLKDAASAAIYGAEGGNGVILVTTKKGSKGNSVIEYRYSHGNQTVPNLPKVMNSAQYRRYNLESKWNDVGLNPTSGADKAFIANYAALDTTKTTNWLDEIFENAPMDEHQFNVSGGNESTNYYLSASSLDQDGTVGGDKNKRKRYSFRANIETQVKPWFSAGTNISYSRIKQKNLSTTDLFGGIISGAMVYDPTIPIYWKDTAEVRANYKGSIDSGFYNAMVRTKEGYYYTKSQNTSGEMWNPLAQLEYSNNSQTQDKLVADMHADFKPVKWAKLTSRVFVDMAYQIHSEVALKHIYGVSPILLDSMTTAKVSNDLWYKYGIENYITLNQEFGKHYVELMVGQSYSDYKHEWYNATGYGIKYNDPYYAYPGQSNRTTLLKNSADDYTNGDPEMEREGSYFGRFAYNYNEKYLFQSSLRYDASSKMDVNYRWVSFPSFSAGWVVSKEDFFANNSALTFINNLKVRASWGRNGNKQALGMFPYMVTMRNVNYVNGNGDLILGQVPSRPSNPEITWETSEQTDFGVDFGFLKNAVTLSVDYFKKSTKGQIQEDREQLDEFGNLSARYINKGQIDNKGWEFDLSHRGSVGEDFKYEISANASYVKNEVIEYNADGKDGYNINLFGYVNRYEVGQPVWYFRGQKALGIFQTQEEIDNYTWTNAKTGVTKKVQLNAKPGDVKFAFVDSTGAPKLEYLGKPMPDWTFGFTLNLEYKWFDLNAFFYAQTGNQIFLGNMRVDKQTFNKPVEWYDNRWTGPGTSNKYPRATYLDKNKNLTTPNSLFVQDGDYLRLKSLNIGFTFPQSLTRKVAISKLRVYYSGTNLLTFTKYTGADPEVGLSDVNNNSSYGVDMGMYPTTKIHTIGVNVTF